jgi:hypothetical protein
VCRFVGEEEHTTKAGRAELIGRSIMAKGVLVALKVFIFDDVDHAVRMMGRKKTFMQKKSLLVREKFRG